MKDGPHIAGIAALLGDRARADMLVAMMGGQALTATELAAVAGVTKQTVSAHLARLLDAGLLSVERQGRHRYFRLADRDVAQLLESLMGVAYRTGAVRLRTSPREPALRKARICYDHLAGELGVQVYESLIERGLLHGGDADLAPTPAGLQFSVPLGRNPARVNLERARLQNDQSQLQLRDLERQVVQQVRDLARQVNTNLRRVATTRAARTTTARSNT